MFIQIDFSSPVPIYEQILCQTKFMIATGAIRKDEFLPSVRELAKMLAINPLTVSRAYRELQNETLVYSRRGMGFSIAADAQERCREERRELFEARFRQLIQEAIRSRLDPDEIRRMLQVQLETVLNDNQTLTNSYPGGEQ